jgi:hypothetical protein
MAIGGAALEPHLQDSLKLSTDPFFVEKVVDVVGLYHNPPERVVVLCVDEKSQIQALDRSQPVLPMMPGMPERRTHDHLRHGITSVFTPIGSSWMNQVERWFGLLTDKLIRRGVHTSVQAWKTTSGNGSPLERHPRRSPGPRPRTRSWPPSPTTSPKSEQATTKQAMLTSRIYDAGHKEGPEQGVIWGGEGVGRAVCVAVSQVAGGR